MAWRKLHAWSPFKIDALGLLTILGADEINQAVGRLTESPIIDWQPQLAAHVIASNQFAKPLSGFNLYNISDGILATDLAGWFARWLLQQDLAWNTSIIYMSKAQPSRPLRWIVSGYVLGICTSVATIVTAGLLRDWWGLTNAISMAVSVMVRQFLVNTTVTQYHLFSLSLTLKPFEPHLPSYSAIYLHILVKPDSVFTV